MRSSSLVNPRNQPLCVDTPEVVADRLRHQEACRLAQIEADQKFSSVTSENFRDSVDFLLRRINEIYATLPRDLVRAKDLLRKKGVRWSR